MNKTVQKLLIYFLCVSSGLLLTITARAELKLPDMPLIASDSVAHNVLLLLDDSDSMNHSLATTPVIGDFSGYFPDPFPPPLDKSAIYLHALPYRAFNPINQLDNSAGEIVPSETKSIQRFGTTANNEEKYGVWRVRYHGYNTIYYNPNITYTPWVGIDKNGKKFGSINYTEAWFNPYNPSAGSLNLLTMVETSNGNVIGPDGKVIQGSISTQYAIPYVGNTLSSYTTGEILPYYYEWTDSNKNGEVDAADVHKKIEIRPASGPGSVCSSKTDTTTTPPTILLGSNASVECPNVFVRDVYDADTGVGRSDCGSPDSNKKVNCSREQELQNFANWFSYHRNRDYVSKGALSRALENLSGIRIGYSVINYNNTGTFGTYPNGNPNRGVITVNADPVTGNKKVLYDSIFTTNPSRGTPLRSGLEGAGEYFKCNNLTSSTSQLLPGAACPIVDTCQQNHTIILSDGVYADLNTDLAFKQSKTFTSSYDADKANSQFDGGAFADGYTQTLADITMHYYESDLSSSKNDEVLPSALDIARYPGSAGYPETDGLPNAMHQHMKTHAIAFAMPGASNLKLPTDPTKSFPWENPASYLGKIHDLQHATYNGRGLYFFSNDYRLSSSIEKIFDEIQRASGAASAVSFSGQDVTTGNVLLFRSSYVLANNTGDLIAQKLNKNGSLGEYLWSAAEQLDVLEKPEDKRVIFTTYADGKAGSLKIAGDDSGDLAAWIRGDRSMEQQKGGKYRNRASLLGTIVDSSPTFVGASMANFTKSAHPAGFANFKNDTANRDELVYIGANDGMLHAIDAETGVEKFAYMPGLFSNDNKVISDLASPDYKHRFFVNATPQYNDAYLNGAWRTVLVSGLGKGGKGYFALDITDPKSFSKENVLWEFTAKNDPDLGYTYSEPLITMTNAGPDGKKRWAAIFGNGYNNDGSAGNAALFIKFLDGNDFIKISTGNGKAKGKDKTTNGIKGITGVDGNNDGTADYVYAGDLQGNLYRFDISATSSGSWNVTNIFTAQYGGASGPIQPITNAPAVIKNPDENGFIVIVGTGSLLTESDLADQSIQSMYGIWDDLSNNVTIPYVKLLEQEFINVPNSVPGFTVRTLTNKPITWGNGNGEYLGWKIDFDAPAAGDASGKAQYPGERAINDFTLAGSLLLFNTVIIGESNANSVCGGKASGFESALNVLNGGSGKNLIFDTSGDGKFDANDYIGGKDTGGIINAKLIEGGKPSANKLAGEYSYTQFGKDANAVQVSLLNLSSSAQGKRLSWRELNID